MPIRAPVGSKPADGKPALGEWKSLQRAAATGETVTAWFNGSNHGVAVIGGTVSGNLLIGDMDDLPFCIWLRENCLEILARTWVVETGSGKIHVYLRQQGTPVSTILKRGGRKLADIRAEGEYVVAPPSIHSFGEPYRTLCGDPAHIALVPDAMAVFNRLADHFSGATAPAIGEDTTARHSDQSYLAPLGSAPRAELLKLLRAALDDRMVQRIMLGEEAPDNSGRDYGIIMTMIERGLSDEQIEETYASFPIGIPTYRNEARAHHGRGYLFTTIDKARSFDARRKEAATGAAGDNFQILTVKRMQFEDPVYEIAFINDIGEECAVGAEHDDMYAEMKFLKRLGRRMQGVPRLPLQYRGKGFLDFADLLLRMATTEDVPPDATAMGHLRKFLISHLQLPRSLNVEPPQAPEGVLLGWKNEDEQLIYVRGGALINAVSLHLRPAPGPEKVWSALAYLGGMPRSYRYETGVKENVWTLPLGVLNL